MARIRLYIDYPFASEKSIVLNENQSHYLIHVLRLKTGDTVFAFHDEEGEWETKLDIQSKKHIFLHVERLIRSPEIQDYKPCLVFSPLKQGPTDFLIEKATELGVYAFYPVITQHSVIHKINETRLRSLAIEASEQCGRLSVPKIHPLRPLSSFLSTWNVNHPLYFCNEKTKENPSSLLSCIYKPQNEFGFLIGPEGGFSEKEADLLKTLPFIKSVSLGANILRAETAALASLSFSLLSHIPQQV
jgi:16S rRNA (uracil1498-N3)-methyltransferase